MMFWDISHGHYVGVSMHMALVGGIFCNLAVYQHELMWALLSKRLGCQRHAGSIPCNGTFVQQRASLTG